MNKVKLPTGLPEFEALVDALQSEFELPTKDRESVRFVVASAILNLGQDEDSKEKEYFVKLLVAAAAKQVAAHVFHEIKTKQKELEQKAKEEAAVAKALEVTKETVTSDVQVDG